MYLCWVPLVKTGAKAITYGGYIRQNTAQASARCLSFLASGPPCYAGNQEAKDSTSRKEPLPPASCADFLTLEKAMIRAKRCRTMTDSEDTCTQGC